MSPEQRNSLPFEPKQKKKKPEKKAPSSRENSQKQTAKSKASLSAIPEVVSNRMVKRMALFCGIPTALGMLSFVVSYLIVVNDWFDLPSVAVVLVSMGFFGLGVLGLTYGILSTSWDENRVGTWLGMNEFTTNLGRMTSAWRSAKEN